MVVMKVQAIFGIQPIDLVELNLELLTVKFGKFTVIQHS